MPGDQKQDVWPRLIANLRSLGRIFHVGFTMANIFYNLILKHYQRLAIRKCNSFQSAYNVRGRANGEEKLTSLKERQNKKETGGREESGVNPRM